MIQIQVLAVTSLATVLASVLVALENVVPGKFDFLLRQMVIDQQQNDTRDPNPE
jgi:hypothetical protein